MKNRLLNICIVSVALLFSLSSCSLIESLKGPKKTEVAEDAIVPDDRQVIQERGAEQAFYNAKDLSQGCIRSDWAIQTVMGQKAVGLEAPYLKFDAKTGAVYGNNGCNTINARYTYNPQDSTINFSDLLTTMRACPGDVTDMQVNQALGHTTRYSWRQEGSNHYIMFYDKADNEMMTLMHQEFDFLNGAWQVTSINEEANHNSDIKLVIDIDQMKIHGNTGCNILNGQLETNPKTVNSISFFAIGVTQRMCPDQGETEKQLLVALEEVVYAHAVSADRVQLLDGKRNPVLELTRVKE